MPAAFIDDGFTLTETIPACHRHPAVEIEFRPLTRREFDRHNSRLVAYYNRQERAFSDGDPDAAEKASDEVDNLTFILVANRLVSWDVTNGNGSKVEINKENLERVDRELMSRIYDMIVNHELTASRQKN